MNQFVPIFLVLCQKSEETHPFQVGLFLLHSENFLKIQMIFLFNSFSVELVQWIRHSYFGSFGLFEVLV